MVLLYHQYPEKVKRAGISIVGLIGLIIYSMNTGDNFYSRMWASALLVYFVVSLEWMFQRDNNLIRFLVRLGDYSYSTYLCHIIVLGWFVAWLGFAPTPGKEIALFLGATITIYFISWLSYRTIETGFLPKILKTMALFVCTPIIAIVNKINRRIKTVHPLS